MILKIHHSTRYTYDQPVPYALQQVRVTPQTRGTQKVHDWKISIQGGDKMRHRGGADLAECVGRAALHVPILVAQQPDERGRGPGGGRPDVAEVPGRPAAHAAGGFDPASASHE